MEVVRIQDKKGRGPFAPGLTSKWMETRQEREFLPPFFMEFPDFKPSGKYHFGCACLTTEQLKRWFNETEYQRLVKLGFQAVKMTVDEVVRKSDNQCVIRRRRAFRKGVTPFNLYQTPDSIHALVE